MILAFRHYNPQEPQLLRDFYNYALPIYPKAIFLCKRVQVTYVTSQKMQKNKHMYHGMHKSVAN